MLLSVVPGWIYIQTHRVREPKMQTNFFACLGGSSANIGVAITRHGGKATLVTRVSDDSVGRFVINELKKYDVDATHVHAEGWRGT